MFKRLKVGLFMLGVVFFTSLATGEAAVVKNSNVRQAVRKANDGLSIGQAKDVHMRVNKIRKHSENSASLQSGTADPCENADPSNASEQCNEKQLTPQAAAEAREAAARAAEEAKRVADEARRRAEEERKKAEEEARRKQEQANNAANQATEAARHLIP